MPSSAAPSLVFGVAAPSSAELSDGGAFEALAAWMAANAGLELTRKTSSTYKELVASVRDGSSDVAWLPPVVYAWLAEAVNPVGSIVRAGRTTYSAALVVPADSARKALTDLAGARAGWVDPWSAAGFVVPRLELARAGVNPSKAFTSETFHGTHRETLLALSRGECDVAATFARTPADGAPVEEGGWSGLDDVRVRVLASYGPIPNDVIAVRRNLEPESYERVLEAFRKACTDAAARPLVRAVFNGDQLREGAGKGHDALRLAYETALAHGLFD